MSTSRTARVRVAVGAVAGSFVLAIALAAAGIVAPRGSGIALGASSTVTVIGGSVLVRHPGGDFGPLADGEIVGPGDVVRTETASRAVLTYFEGSTVEIEPDSELAIDEASARPDGSTVILMAQNLGHTWHVVAHLLNAASRYQVRTPNTTASVRGTAFEVAVAEGETIVTTTEGRVAAADAALTTEVLVTPGLTTTVTGQSAPEPPRPAPEPARTVTVTVGSASSVVVDPLGRSNGIRDGKLVIQTPGTQVTTQNGQLIVVLRNVPDGKLATVIERRDRSADDSVAVTTTVDDRARGSATSDDRVKLSESRTVTGVDVRAGGPAGAPVIRPVDEQEKKDLPKDKVLPSARPPQAAPIFRPGAPPLAESVPPSESPAAAESRKPSESAKSEEATPPQQAAERTPEARRSEPPQAVEAARTVESTKKADESERPQPTPRAPSGFLPALPLAPLPAIAPPKAQPSESSEPKPAESAPPKRAESTAPKPAESTPKAAESTAPKPAESTPKAAESTAPKPAESTPKAAESTAPKAAESAAPKPVESSAPTPEPTKARETDNPGQGGSGSNAGGGAGSGSSAGGGGSGSGSPVGGSGPAASAGPVTPASSASPAAPAQGSGGSESGKGKDKTSDKQKG